MWKVKFRIDENYSKVRNDFMDSYKKRLWNEKSWINTAPLPLKK